MTSVMYGSSVYARWVFCVDIADVVWIISAGICYKVVSRLIFSVCSKTWFYRVCDTIVCLYFLRCTVWVVYYDFVNWVSYGDVYVFSHYSAFEVLIAVGLTMVSTFCIIIFYYVPIWVFDCWLKLHYASLRPMKYKAYYDYIMVILVYAVYCLCHALLCVVVLLPGCRTWPDIICDADQGKFQEFYFLKLYCIPFI